MYFLLHHSTGTLMLDAHDKVAVLTWSERQLGDAAKRAAIIELGGDPPLKQVEKSGTGIQKFSCKPVLSIMAHSTQHLSEAKIGEVHFAGHWLDTNSKSYRFSIH